MSERGPCELCREWSAAFRLDELPDIVTPGHAVQWVRGMLAERDGLREDAARYRALRARLDNGPAWWNDSWPSVPSVAGVGAVGEGVQLLTLPPRGVQISRGRHVAASLDALADRTVMEWRAGPPPWWPDRPDTRSA